MIMASCLFYVNYLFQAKKLLLLRVLHQFNQVVEEDVSVPVAESVNFVAHLSGVMVDRETSFPRFEMLVLAHSVAQFLEVKK